MAFDKLNLKISYRSNECNIDNDFFKICLKESVRYDRAVGYFTSDSLKLIIDGLKDFLENDGKIRIITSLNLQEKDINAILNGDLEKEKYIELFLIDKWDEIINDLDIKIIDLLSWLIATEKLKIKIASNKNLAGIYHEKFGIFYDENNNKIAFIGSANETAGGYRVNFESLDVYNELDGGKDKIRIEEKVIDFEKLWENNTEKIEVITLPEAIKTKIIQCTSKEMLEKIRDYNQKNNLSLKNPDWLEIREYQEEAYLKWKENKGIGILNMATGTGKTLTALTIIANVNKLAHIKNKKIFYVIVCPQIQLSTQWKEDIIKFGNVKIIECNSTNKNWCEELTFILNCFKYSIIDTFVVLVSNSTYITEAFQNIITEKVYKYMMLVVDECHNIGSNKFKELLELGKFKNIPYRLGLSATPKRYNDSIGNEVIEKILGDEVFEFTLEEAIEKEFLSKYYYYPIFVTFNIKEEDEYVWLSSEIIKFEILLKSDIKDKKSIEKKLELRKYKRARLIQNLEEKRKKCIELLSSDTKKDSTHNLIYVGAGKNEDDEKYIDLLLNDLSKIMKVNKFTSVENSTERNEIIKEFTSGKINSLLAIKCLDEGINIPQINTAIILSSTSNPKEFIQRRGRILRKYPGKEFATIYDFIVIPRRVAKPNEYFNEINKNIEKQLIKKEFERLKEYSRLAINHLENELKILDIFKEIGI